METKKYENVTIYKIITTGKGTIEAYPVLDDITLYQDQSNSGYYYYIDDSDRFIGHILSDEGDLDEEYYDDNSYSYETYFWLQAQNKNMIEGIIKEYARIEYNNIVREIEALQRKEKLYKRYLED